MSPEQRTRWPTAVAHNPFYAESREPLGRDEEIRRIKDMLCAGNHCSIVGPPGSGKTLLLKAIRPGLSSRIGCRPEEVSFVHFRGITRLVELQEVIVDHLGGTKANEWRRLLTYKPLRLLVLDDLGGMDPGARGRNMRRWLRSLYDSAGTKLRRYRTGATPALGEATEQCLEPRERRAQRSLDGAGNGGPHAAARRVRERRRAQRASRSKPVSENGFAPYRCPVMLQCHRAWNIACRKGTPPRPQQGLGLQRERRQKTGLYFAHEYISS